MLKVGYLRTDAGIKRTARVADAWMTDPAQSLGVQKRFAALYRSEAAKRERRPYVALMRDLWVTGSMKEARRESDPLMCTHRFYFRNRAYVPDEYLRGVESEDQWTFDRAAKDRFIVGAPEDCLEQLQKWRQELEPDYLILRMRHPGGPEHKRIVEAIRLFGYKVLPHL